MALEKTFYNYPKLTEFFENREQIYSIELDTDNILITNINDEKLYMRPDTKVCEKLYKQGKESKVGKNKTTVVDRNVRSSVEFTDLSFDEKFLDYIKNEIKSAVEDMKAGIVENIQVHKIIIYGKGDFFEPHMDSVHTKEQTMTAVLELPTEWNTRHNERGAMDGNWGLRVKDEYFYRNKNNPMLYIFDHDLRHEINTIKSGYRISISFDLVIKPYETKIEFLEEMVNDMKKLGVKRFGFFAQHLYFGDQQSPCSASGITVPFGDQSLKDVDYQLVNQLKNYTKSFSKIKLTNYADNWWYNRVVELMKLGSESSLWNEIYEDDNRAKKFYHDIEDWPTDWNYEPPYDDVIKNELCLNDIFCLSTPNTGIDHTHTGSEEIHLGNEGFEGEIYEGIFFVFDLE